MLRSYTFQQNHHSCVYQFRHLTMFDTLFYPTYRCHGCPHRWVRNSHSSSRGLADLPWCSPYTPMYVPIRTSLRFLSCRAHYPLSCFGTCTLDRIRTCNLDDISILRLPLRHESIFSMMSKNYLLFDYKDSAISFSIQAFFLFFSLSPKDSNLDKQNQSLLSCR